jgi:hypothetical protein
VFVFASSAIAQTKASGTFECGKADPTYTIQIPDREGYSLAIGQVFKPEGFSAQSFFETQGSRPAGGEKPFIQKILFGAEVPCGCYNGFDSWRCISIAGAHNDQFN